MIEQPKLSYEEIEKQLADFKALILEHEKRQNHYYGYRTIKDQAAEVMIHYQREAENAITSGKALVADLLIYLRAFAMVLEMVGNASTHAEKAARLRGAIEMIETTIQRLRDEQFRIIDSYWRSHPDLFRSDYPVREHKERIYQLEHEVEELKAKLLTKDRQSGEVTDPTSGETDESGTNWLKD